MSQSEPHVPEANPGLLKRYRELILIGLVIILSAALVAVIALADRKGEAGLANADPSQEAKQEPNPATYPVQAAEKASSVKFKNEDAELGDGDLHALLVGVSKYRDQTIPQLSRPSGDANEFAEYLKTQTKVFRQTHIHVLKDEKATRIEILKRLKELAGEVEPNDTFLMFVSGHGKPETKEEQEAEEEYYFLPHDAVRDMITETSVKMSGLDFLDKIKARRKIVIADACFAGKSSKWASKALKDHLQAFKRSLKNSQGVAVMMSSAGNQESYEVEEFRNSVFTHYLLKGLRGDADSDGNGQVSLSEAHDYVTAEVARFTENHMNPKLDVDAQLGTGEFPLAYLAEVDPKRVLAHRLHQNTMAGNTAEVAYLVRHKSYIIHERGRNNRSALHMAAEQGHLEIVDLLISAGASIEAKDNEGNTPLILAARSGHPEVVELLLKSGAEKHAKGRSEYTALHEASNHSADSPEEKADYRRVAELLLENDAVVRARNQYGSTPLALATYIGDAEITRLLLEHGADPLAEDNKGRNPFSTACRYGHREIVRMLLNNGVDIADLFSDKGDLERLGPIFFKVLHGDAEGIKDLVHDGVDLNKASTSGDTALTLASALGYADVVKALVEAGADINLGNADSHATPLMWAASNGNLDVIKVLVESKADIHRKTNKDYNALMLAAKLGHPKCLEYLHSKGASLSDRNDEDHSAINLAAAQGHPKVVEYLLAHGMDPNDRIKKDGSTPIILAAENGHTDVVKLLLEAKADVAAQRNVDNKDSALTVACSKGHTDIVKHLLKHGAHPDSRNVRAPAITLAAEKGHADIATLLRAHGARIDVKDREGFTPRQVALRGGHKGLAKSLSDEGASKSGGAK